jgi:SEC-C motif-containing protein
MNTDGAERPGEDKPEHEHEHHQHEHVHGPDCDHHHEAEEPFRRVAAKVGRNDPCSCGSGKKFKKCCGKA